jgi:hypothetical protein
VGVDAQDLASRNPTGGVDEECAAARGQQLKKLADLGGGLAHADSGGKDCAEPSCGDNSGAIVTTEEIAYAHDDDWMHRQLRKEEREREGEGREERLLLGSRLARLAKARKQLGVGESRVLALDLLATLAGLLVGPLALRFGAGGVRHRSAPV